MTHELVDIARARAALHAIDPGCPREEWHEVGRAAIAAGLTVDDIDEWSSGAPNYAGSRDIKSAFRTIVPNGGTGAGTLFAKAMQAGWNPASASDQHQRPTPRPPARSATPRPASASRAPSACDVWARCQPAGDGHPYIEAKCGRPDGLRVVAQDDALCIAGSRVAGWLVVPVVPLAGTEPVSLQFIPPPGAGKKLNLPGARMDGVFIVGQIDAGGTVYLCEGIGQAWACWKATGSASICCFGWGNVRKAGAELRRRDPAAQIVLVPDIGKEGDARRIAEELGAAVACMPVGSPDNFDANDFGREYGFDALEQLLSAESKAHAQPPHPLATFVPLELAHPKVPEFIIDNVMVAAVVVLAGGEGQGKTVQLVSLLVKAAWLCRSDDPMRPILRRRVIYITEDVRQVRLILASILRFGGTGCTAADFEEWFKVVPATRGPAERFVEVAPEYAKLRTANRMAGGEMRDVDPVVVIDTKSAVLATDDENDNAKTSNDIAVLKQQFGLPVIIVGHLAKALSKSDVSSMSMRGAGSAQGDANQTMFLYHDKDSDKRYLHIGPPAKRRFESPIEALEFTAVANQIDAVDPLNNVVKLWIRHSSVHPITGENLRETRAAVVADRRAEEQRTRDTELRTALLDAVEAAQQDGIPLSRSMLVDRVRGYKTDDKRATIGQLLAEAWLIEARVPARWRMVNNARRTWLVRLSAIEREQYIATGESPAAAKRPPPTIATRDEEGGAE